MAQNFETDLDMYAGADQAAGELPEGLDFGNDIPDDETPADEPTTEVVDGAGDDAADAAGDGSGAAGTELDDADDGDDGAPDGEQPESAEKPEKKGKEPFIPKSRLDQAIRKQRLAEQRAQEVERELAELRAAQAEAARPKPLSADELKAKMVEANEALVAGDTDKASALQAEVLAAMAQPQVERPDIPAAVDLAAQVEERLEFKTTLREVYDRFPELDENSEVFDEELGAESVELQRSYLNRGYSLAEATRKAGEAVAKLHDLQDRRAEQPDAKPAPEKKAQQAKTQEKIAKATKAPPVLGGKAKGEGDEKIDINSLSEDEFMALPESVRNRLLGVTL